MEVQQALLIGIDHTVLADPLGGAVRDVVDLAQQLIDRGTPVHLVTSPRLPDEVLPGVPRSDGTLAEVERALHDVAARMHDDAPTLVHISARGQILRGEPCVLLADAPMPLTSLSRAFAATPVRSVSFVLDVGFAGGQARGSRSWGPPMQAPQPLPALGDPTVLAGGLTGPVTERPIAGEVRGVFTRMFASLLADPSVHDWSFARLVAVLRRLPGDLALEPVVLPPTDAHHLLGAPAPWRGVQAAFQWEPTHDVVSRTPRFGAHDGMEQFDFGTGTAFPSGQFSVSTEPGPGNLSPPGPGVFDYTNNPFDQGSAVPNPPSVTAADRVYEVTASWGLPGTTYAIFRDAASGSAQDAEWVTTANVAKFDVASGGTITFTEASLPSATQWQNQGPWFGVTQMKQ